MKLFVPGRICLFGEHSDWAARYRQNNSEIEKGYTLITSTNQGVYAEVKPHPNRLILKTSLSDGTRHGPYSLPMERSALLAEAEKGEFFSYAAGVAYQILTNYRVQGLEIDNYLTDLPVKKGLSSSAAISVLVARAFNRTYDLKMTTRDEMEYAYRGETTTPSRCGRMDQGCAYQRPILMTFDGDNVDVRELSVSKDLYLVIVDLGAGKDTLLILNQLNHCYPFAESELERNVQHYLGPISAQITQEAHQALRDGDAETVGKLMTRAQTEFDKHLIPACPSQLTAPVLHKVLNYEPIQPYIWGGKGVGSQGDGSAQFIAKDKESQGRVIEIIEQNLQMSCLKLVIEAGRRVRKAVIPAAGFGTRLFPASKAMKKELFPVIDKSGRAKPAIMAIVEEAINAGIEEVCLIIQSGDTELFESFFKTPPRIEHYNKLSKENKAYCDYLLELGSKVTFVTQDVQEGFGHAVYCAREWVGNEPFLLMLGDHLYGSDEDKCCARQVVEAYEQVGHSVVGLKKTPIELLSNFGCVTGRWKEEDSLLSVTEFYEKPDAEYAMEHLHVDGMDIDQFLTVFGIYVIQPQIFEFLEQNIVHNLRERGEFQLTSCLDALRKAEGFSGYVVKGRRFDIGLPEEYRQTVVDFRNA
ncbi:GHMP kinase [Candidatus Poribacteria bacterium]|nr:GHMP kinase [Candidatus Poribacteria bacterium]MYG05520.1 GHMP kinase [Candidatus Poribacteria bacterium]MYK22039.1 GHMP kinase [Candidatus Poribacteria bacterium]